MVHPNGRHVIAGAPQARVGYTSQPGDVRTPAHQQSPLTAATDPFNPPARANLWSVPEETDYTPMALGLAALGYALAVR